MKVYVCLEWHFDAESVESEWRIAKAVKDELSAIRWCGNDGYRRYEECELEKGESRRSRAFSKKIGRQRPKLGF